MKRFKNVVLSAYNGDPIKIPKSDTDASLVDCTLKVAMQAILANAPMKTQNDSIQGMRLAQALDKADEFIELEEGVHDWLKTVAEGLTPPLFRVNGNIVYELIKEGFEKPKVPAKGAK